MARRKVHPEEEEEEIEVEEEEDESCYSFGDEEGDEEVGDEDGGESDDFSSSNGDDEAGEPGPMVKKFPAELKPVRTKVKREQGAPTWPPSAPPPGFTQRRTPPLRPYIVSASVPGSRSSSPRSPSGADLVTAALQKWNQRGLRSSSNLNPRSRRRSSARLPGRQEADQLRRSKSCGEGRASQPPDEMDIWPKITVSGRQEAESVGDSVGEGPAGAERRPTKPNPRTDDGFKCGAFCMFLPGFSKGKQVQPHNREAANGAHVTARISVASRAASLEKFECGSWSSSVILSGARDEEEGIPPSYFDLPLELMRGSGNDTDSPVKAAFVFDGDRRRVLRHAITLSKASATKGAASSRRSTHESPGRHVTFSAAAGAALHASVPSSPTAFCISPRLRKARDDFNAFLEAQDA